MAASSLSSSFNGGKVDVSLLNLDLGQVVMGALGSDGTIRGITRDIVKWLGRERINESDYDYCLQRTSGVAYPNEVGEALKERIFHSSGPKAIPGLRLVSSGAVGRWMALSKEHSYMVTTTVVVSRFRKVSAIPQLLCDMAFAHGDLKNTKTGPPAPVIRMRLLGVISKVVESISLNVTNLGHNVNDFPDELKGQCQRHLLDTRSFAMIAAELQKYRGDVHLVLVCEVRADAEESPLLLN